MNNKQKIKTKLKSYSFDIISNISSFSYEDTIGHFTRNLEKTLKAYSGLFIYNNWDSTYELIADKEQRTYMKQSLFKDEQAVKNAFNQFIENRLPSNKYGDLFTYSEEIKIFFAPLQQGFQTTEYIFIVVEKERLSEDVLHMVKDTAEQFLSQVASYNINKTDKEKNKFLYELSSKLYSVTNLTTVLRETVDSFNRLYPTFTCSILLSQDYDADSTLPVQTINYSQDSIESGAVKSFTTGEVKIEYRQEEEKVSLYVPLKGSQGVYGVIQIITNESIEFPKSEIDFIERFAEITGNAIESVALYQNSIRLVKDLKLINNVTHKLNSNLKLTDITMILKEQIMNMCETIQVGFVHYKKGVNFSFEILKDSSPYFTSKEGYPFILHLVERLKKKPEAIFSGDFKNHYEKLPFRSIITIPMSNQKKVFGFVTIMHKKPAFFSLPEFNLFESLVQHSALAFTNTVLTDQLKDAVITDYLTKLYSRSYLDELIDMHMEVDDKGTLVLFDIDDFKNVNDTYGHLIGDKVIVQVADIIMDCSGETNIPARWGGEEIAVYLPHIDLNTGVKLAGNIREEVAKQTNPRVTLSSGVATWSKDSHDTVSTLFIRADEALYKAKTEGKNRVVTEEINS